MEKVRNQMKKVGIIAVLVCLIVVMPVLAQDGVTAVDIRYDEVVTDTITEEAFFDWWILPAREGDVIEVVMDASEGLVPLIGLLDEGRNLVARSDDDGVAEVNGRALLRYTALQDGEYIIVATREGNENGTSTGSYTLSVRRANVTAPNTTNELQPVEFRCGEFTAITATTILFDDDPDVNAFYRISVYGLDDFQPVIHISFIENELTDCSRDAQQMMGDSLSLPDGTTFTVDEDTSDHAAQVNIRATGVPVGAVTVLVGSEDGAPGRYVLVLEGFSIAAPGDRDLMTVRIGPRARATDMQFYMLAGERTRLDPFLLWEVDDFTEIICDDIGRRDCTAVPSFEGSSITLTAGGGRTLTSDRFDAGLLLNPGTPDPMYLRLGSRGDATAGSYSVVILGELPPATTDSE